MERGASALEAAGASPRANVLLVLEPCVDWMIGLAAILRANCVAVPMPHDTPPDFVRAIAAACQSPIVVHGDRSAPQLAALQGITAIHASALRSAEPADRPASVADGNDVAMLAFTSGSTQGPRAVELTHANLLANLRGLLAIRGGSPDDAMLALLPPSHLFALVTGILAPLACGAPVVFPGSLLPNRLIDTLRDGRITHAIAVPALAECLYREILDRLIDAGLAAESLRREGPAEARRALQSKSDEESLEIRNALRSAIGPRFQSLIVGGAAINPDLAEVIASVGIGVELGYGLTEAGPIVSVGRVGQCPRRSVGQPIPGVEVRIDAIEEILVRSPGVMRSYFRDPVGTAAAIRDGWLCTGDRGHRDGNGNLFITGRIKEAMVLASGRTVYPEEIEPYYASARFAEICVAGVPDVEGNDVPSLFVVPAPSVTAEDIAAAFEALTRAAPEGLRVARFVLRAAPLPRTGSGKVRRKAVVEHYVRESALR